MWPGGRGGGISLSASFRYLLMGGMVATIVATVYFEWNVYLSRVIT
jgi:hypothetical protein